MHTMRKIIGMGLTLAFMIGMGGVSATGAQDQARAKVLGVWEGTLTYGATASAVMEFTQDGETIKWRYSFRTTSEILWGDAEGTVTSFSPPILEARGVYNKHSVPGGAGTGVKASLTVDGDQMKGTVTADLNNLPIQVSLTRKK
jgi:hypothetical protein